MEGIIGTRNVLRKKNYDLEGIMKDNCQICKGEKGGVPGNENIVEGIVMCDYCHSAVLMQKLHPHDAVAGKIICPECGEETVTGHWVAPEGVLLPGFWICGKFYDSKGRRKV